MALARNSGNIAAGTAAAGDNSIDEDLDYGGDIVTGDNYEREGNHSIDDGSIVIVDCPHHVRLIFSRETFHHDQRHVQVRRRLPMQWMLDFASARFG
mgnify:CR=1 FL=1